MTCSLLNNLTTFHHASFMFSTIHIQTLQVYYSLTQDCVWHREHMKDELEDVKLVAFLQ